MFRRYSISQESSMSQLSYTHGTSEKPLLGQTIGDCLDEIALRFPDVPALISCHENLRLTYAQFAAEVDRCARALMALGVEKAHHVGIWSTNCAAWTITQFATAKIGAILVNINPAYRSTELEFALRQSECNFLVIGEGFRDANYAQILRDLIGPDLSDVPSASPATSKSANPSDNAKSSGPGSARFPQ